MWPTKPLGELVQDGELPYGVVQPGFQTPTGVPMIRVKDLRNGRVDQSEPLTVAHEVSARHSRTVLQGGELLLSIVGTIGEAAVAPRSVAGWNVARAIAVIRPVDVSAEWIRISLQTADVRNKLTAALNTTVQATLNLADLRRLEIPVPPEPQRRGITEVLGALDDKIAANTSLGSVADELVRAQYTRISAVSREATTIGDLATHPRSLVDPTELDPMSLYVGLEHVPRRLMWLDDSGSADAVTSTKASFSRGDVLFGKLRPYFHKVVSAPSDGICSTDILVVRPSKSELAGFVLAAASSDATVERCTAASEGTRMPRTSWKDLAAIEVPWPNESEAQTFSADVDVLRRRVEAAVIESRTLAQVRDALLPRLMSGKIKVKDAERVVEGVV